jgi:hypothetical protein
MNTNTYNVAEKFSIIAVLKKINHAVHKGTRNNASVFTADEEIRGKLCLVVDTMALK